MISLIVCSDDAAAVARHAEHHRASAGAAIETVHVRSTPDRPGLCAAYTEGVRRATGDVLVFTHDDAFVVTPGWATMVQTFFSSQEAFGALGVAGTQRLGADRLAWFAAERPFVFGKVIHEIDGRSVLTIYSRDNGTREVVAFDGVWFAVRRDLFEHIAFDADTFDGFHFYDLDTCMQLRQHTRLAVTTDLLVKHRSAGRFSAAWEGYAERFRAKWHDALPATCTEVTASTGDFESIPLDQAMDLEPLARIRVIGRPPRETPPPWQEKGMIVVAGMHRSGTSCVTGLLDRCGYGVGAHNELLGENQPRHDNMKGHFERRDVVQIDDALLKAAGGSWNEPPSGEAITAAAASLELSMQLFLEDFDGLVIKDPRLSLTLPVWRERGMKLRHVVLCLRHPLQVARSLHKRDGMPIERGLQLWHDHNRRLVDALDDVEWSVVDYDRIREGAVLETIWPLVERLGDGPSPDDAAARIEGFFDARLDHSEEAEDDLPTGVRDLYEHLRRLSQPPG